MVTFNRDKVYEEQILLNQKRHLFFLEQFSTTNNWTETDYYAIERLLQVYIESFIGVCRYYAQVQFQLPISKSRQALDELHARGALDTAKHANCLKVIGFRNILVHDYLNINKDIVRAIVQQKEYRLLNQLTEQWLCNFAE